MEEMQKMIVYTDVLDPCIHADISQKYICLNTDVTKHSMEKDSMVRSAWDHSSEAPKHSGSGVLSKELQLRRLELLNPALHKCP